MPWAQTDPVNERLRFVIAVRKHKGSTFKSLCAAFGVAPKTGYKWLQQFEAEGPAGLLDRSRRPKSNSRAMSEEMAYWALWLRRRHKTWGPKKIVAGLKETWCEGKVPAASTVGELLKRHGLVAPRKRRFRGKHRLSEPLRHATEP